MYSLSMLFWKPVGQIEIPDYICVIKLYLGVMPVLIIIVDGIYLCTNDNLVFVSKACYTALVGRLVGWLFGRS